MKKYLLFLGCLCSFTLLLAQHEYALAEGSSCTTHGTSNVHDWSAKVRKLEGSFQAASDQLSGIQSGEIRFAVKSMDGGRGETMNNNMYEAFDAANYPEIVFQLDSLSYRTDEASKPVISAHGRLEMAGGQQALRVEMEATQDDQQQWVLDGKHRLKMTDFGMEPPNLLFGQMVVGDEIDIDFHLILTKKHE
ncbi:MAG: YceI family protein [Bacteroidota bacterium]